MALHEPLDGFYKGTRFDRAGVFDSILLDGSEMAGRWFSHYDPMMHDAVCGPAEEFSPIISHGAVLKIGVGVLRLPDQAPYDRFRLYEILNPGTWEFFADEDSVTFRHILPGIYEYEKVIALTGETSFEIRHSLESAAPLSGEVYNHNFFTLGKIATGPSRQIDFPFCPVGTWRAVYDSVAFTHSGIRFSRPLREGESVFTGDVHAALSDTTPYRVCLAEEPYSVEIDANVPMTHAVMWANHRIACIEPYNTFSTAALAAGAPSATTAPCRWTLRYRLAKG